VTKGGQIVTWRAGRRADIEQAEVFHSLLAAHRAELCNRLDEQAIKLARYERNQDSVGARRKHRRIKEIGADIRDIDRMMHALSRRLLGSQQEHRSP
jgi:hypothetical protein